MSIVKVELDMIMRLLAAKGQHQVAPIVPNFQLLMHSGNGR